MISKETEKDKQFHVQQKKLYVVVDGEYSDYSIEGIFDDKALAESYRDELNKAQPTYPIADIEEWELNKPRQEGIARQYWQCRMDGKGNIEKPWKEELWAMADPNARGESKTYPGINLFYGKSYISQDHANKLAAEARQQWLREQTLQAKDKDEDSGRE